MKFTNKKAVINWLEDFTSYFSYDPIGNKHYFVFDDAQRGGSFTLMRYEDGTFTLHGKGESYCDNRERKLSFDHVVSLVWKNRKYIHRSLSKGEVTS